MITPEIVFSNMIEQIEQKLPITSRTTLVLDEFTIDEDIVIKDFKKYKFMRNDSFYRKDIERLLEYIVCLYDSNKYCSFYIRFSIKNFYRGKIDTVYDIQNISYTVLRAKCKTCLRMDNIHHRQDVDKCIEEYKFNSCCRKAFNVKRNSIKLSENNTSDFYKGLKQYFEKESINKGKFILKDRYRIQCRNSHIVRFIGGDALSYTKCDSEVKCWICEDKLNEKYNFFKLLDELGVNYYIEERFKDGKELIGISLYLKKISRLLIYTYNDKRHLTGKIVFSDLLGEHQAKANANNLVFRWFDIKRIDDYEYCKIFLNSFFEDIISKNKLLKRSV